MCSGVGSRVLLDWVSPFGHPRITARLPAPRGLSQAPTSFIGSWCQGIHRVPLKTCHRKLKMLASTMQFSSYERNPPPKPGAYPAPAPTGDPKDTRRTTRTRQFTAAAAQRATTPTTRIGARSLRTQQRARPAPPHPRFPTPDPDQRPRPGSTHAPRSSTSQLADVPPMSNHPGTRVRAVALNPNPPPRTHTGNGQQAEPDAP
jgi:hypothetical protein